MTRCIGSLKRLSVTDLKLEVSRLAKRAELAKACEGARPARPERVGAGWARSSAVETPSAARAAWQHVLGSGAQWGPSSSTGDSMASAGQQKHVRDACVTYAAQISWAAAEERRQRNGMRGVVTVQTGRLAWHCSSA